RDNAVRFAAMSTQVSVWGATFFAGVLRNKVALHALSMINEQRNNLAHGRKSLSFSEIKDLVAQGLQLDGWAKISDADGELRLADWNPWVVDKAGQAGLFEQWQKNAFRYLVPETGEVFKMPRNSAAVSD